MSPERRLEQRLPSLLDDLYVGPTPAYRDYVLDRTARTRQRPAWSFVGRWLPMVDIARQPVDVQRLPWRAAGLGFVLLALLVALVAALAVVGRPNLPKPFGPARNGLVTYASGGDIYTVDPVTGRSTAIVSGPETDLNPRWSRDGTRIVFQREAYFGAASSYLYVVRSDGSDLTRVTPQPLAITNYEFSPDGKSLLISVVPGGIPGMVIAATDGSGMHRLDVGMPATNAAWRPPNGSEILFMDDGNDYDGSGFGGIHLVSAQGGAVRTILSDDRAAGHYRGHPEWSPDGSMISFGEWTGADTVDVQTHIIAVDGSGRDRVLPLPPGAVWQAPYGWSNDGTRLLVIRGYTGGTEKARPVAIPVDASGYGTEIPYPGGMANGPTSTWEWAPDDSTILGTPFSASGDLQGQLRLDPVQGTSRSVPWTSDSPPSWQRLAP